MLDLDNDQIYDINTGETVGEIENLTEEQLKKLLERNKDDKNVQQNRRK